MKILKVQLHAVANSLNLYHTVVHLVGKSITNVTSTTARYCNKLINIFPICCAKTCKVYPGRKEGRVEILGVSMHNHVLDMHIQVQIIILVTFTPTFEMNLFLM